MENILISMDQKILDNAQIARSANCDHCVKKNWLGIDVHCVRLSHNDRFIGSFIHTFYECVSNVMWHFTFFFSLASINLSFCDICGLFWRHLLFKLFNLNLSIYLFDWFVSVEKKKHLKLWPIQFSEISVIYRKFPITVKILLWNTEKNKTQRLNKIL